MTKIRRTEQEKYEFRENLIPILSIPKVKPNKILRYIGYGCIALGVVTTAIPFTGLVLYPLGFSMLGISFVKVKRLGLYKYNNKIFQREIKNKLLLIRSKI